MNEDNLSRGYVALYRSVIDNPFYTQLPGDYFKVFIFCLVRAAYKPRQYWNGHAMADLPIGSFVATVAEVSAKTGVTRETVRRALKALENGQMVVTKSTNKFSLHTVVNFEAYQNGILSADKQTTNSATNHRQTSDKPPTNERHISLIREEGKEEDIPLPGAGVTGAGVPGAGVPSPKAKSKKKPTDYPLFDEFWETASKWNGEDKSEALKAWQRDVKDEALARRIIDAAKAQCQTLIDRGIAGGYRPAMAVTWLNKKRYENVLTLPFDAPIPPSPEEQAAKAKQALDSINQARAARGLPPKESS